MRTILLGLTLAAAILGTSLGAQRPESAKLASTDIEVLPVQGNVSAIFTGTTNVVVQVGPLGAVVVDTGTPAVTERILAEVARLTDQPVRLIINTNVDRDHIGGNATIAKRGKPLPGTQADEVPIIGFQTGVDRLSRETVDQLPVGFWPSDTFSGPKKSLHLNGEPIEIIHVPGAHTDADVIVHFRRSDVLAAGDVFSTNAYPMFSAESGGSIQGVLDGLNRIIDITVAELNQQGGTLVVPAHGRLANESDVVEYRDMATIVRDRITLMIERGRTLDQIKAARPTLEYDGLYGAGGGTWTTAAFIEAVYRDLARSSRQTPSKTPAARQRSGSGESR
jgi:glyoxylase-like metal-dependent hydrolase (beta-lactamase superfamily II)